MPLYSFECTKCGEVQECVFKIDECPVSIPCSQCGDVAKKILSLGHGGIQCDSINDVPWLPSALDNLQPDGEKRLESRSEWKAYLKEKGMRATG